MSSQRWLPMESNPDVMNKFLHSVGLSSEWTITDVLGLDGDLLTSVGKPVAALILLVPNSDACQQFSHEKYRKVSNYSSDKVYFMKQTIGNACGTVAMIHAVANSLEVVKLGPGALKDFVEATKNLDPEERSKKLEEQQDICNAHDEVAKEGQTATPAVDDKVDYHFVAFVYKGCNLYELDGHKNGPLKIGITTPDDFLQDAANECKRYMERDPENINFTVLALSKAN